MFLLGIYQCVNYVALWHIHYFYRRLWWDLNTQLISNIAKQSNSRPVGFLPSKIIDSIAAQLFLRLEHCQILKLISL